MMNHASLLGTLIEKSCVWPMPEDTSLVDKKEVFTVKFAGSEVKEKILKWKGETMGGLVTCNLSPHH